MNDIKEKFVRRVIKGKIKLIENSFIRIKLTVPLFNNFYQKQSGPQNSKFISF